VWCSYPEINDVGLTALRHPDTGQLGFSVRVGGGLSTDPHLSRRLDAFVPWHQAPAVVKGVAEIFRDSDVLRQSREKARLKFLFLHHGWTEARFLAELETRLGQRFAAGAPEAPPEDVYRDHVGIHAQKQPGLAYIGIAVLRGRLTSAQLRAVAQLAERYGTGDLRSTGMQNLLVLNVPRSLAEDLARELAALGLRVDASSFWRGTIACTGTEFCKIALTETKGFARRLVADLESRLPGFEEHLKIHVTGCPNSCGQHWIADLGLEGKKLKLDGRLVDAYYFCVGGSVGGHAAVARPVGYRVAAPEVPGAIERLLRAFLAERRPGQNFRQFCSAHTDEELRHMLAGEATAAVERDIALARPPHGVDG
jgi:sulfite reductase (ferredoxin)